MSKGPQIAIILKDGQWFIRRIAWTHRDDNAGEMVYHCDEHLGGPFAGWREMANAVDAYLLNQDYNLDKSESGVKMGNDRLASGRASSEQCAIEVTPEMIEAGMDEYALMWPELWDEDPEGCISRIVRRALARL